VAIGHSDRTDARVGTRLRLATAVLFVLCAVFASSASATVWHYGAHVLPQEYNGNCVWYYYYATCSAWNPWLWHETEVGYGSFTGLTGFENYNTIRGQWIYSNQQKSGHPLDYGFGYQSLKAHVTWWSGDSMQVHWANAWT
jgi:hypothetical protein